MTSAPLLLVVAGVLMHPYGSCRGAAALAAGKVFALCSCGLALHYEHQYITVV
jgi:hypothetical protein